MFSLRLLGLTYTQIAAKTDYSEAHIRRLFAKGGALYDLWLEFQKSAFEEGVQVCSHDVWSFVGHNKGFNNAGKKYAARGSKSYGNDI